MKKRIIFTCAAVIMSAYLSAGCARQEAYVISAETADEAAVYEQPDGELTDLREEEPNGMSDQTADGASQEQTADSKKEQTAQIYVDVDGAVRYPGVYALDADARVFDAVDAAGGLLPEACREALNQAEHISDGQKLYVLNQTEWETQKETAGTKENAGTQETAVADDGRIDLNRATESELCTLSGIGQTRAQAIIAYREACGGFQSIDEIQNVSGIKSGTFEKIKNKIKVQ